MTRPRLLAMLRNPAGRLLLAWLVLLPAARADEVRVLAAGAAKHAIEEIAPEFTRATGHTLDARFDTVGALRERVLQAPAGEAADVVVLSESALQALAQAGRLGEGQRVTIGSVVVALAVPQGAALPDLSTPAALREALLAAPSIAYADPARGATAGTHFAKVVQALGLQEALRGKTTVLPFGVEVIRAVSQGRYALGVSQSSEIMQHPEVRFAGGLPPPHAQATAYGAAPASARPGTAALLDFLRGPLARKAFEASGFTTAP